MLVTELRNLPDEFIAVLPKICPDCGQPMYISDTLRELYCDNIECPSKLVQRALAMLQDLGVKNFGESRCAKLMAYYNMTSPLEFFGFDAYGYDGSVDGLSQAMCIDFMNELDKHSLMTLWEYVKYANIPNIRDSARLILTSYDDLETFYADLDIYGVDLIQDKLGIKCDGCEVSVRALKIYESFMNHRNELLSNINNVEITKPLAVFNICISTSVGEGYSSKADFVAKMNERYNGKYHINFLSAVSKGIDYLIWSGVGAVTSKVNKAMKLGIPIVTGNEFRDILDETLNEL